MAKFDVPPFTEEEKSFIFSLTTEELQSCPKLIFNPSHWNTETKKCKCVDVIAKGPWNYGDPPQNKSDIIAQTTLSHGMGMEEHSKDAIKQILGGHLNVVILSEILFKKITEHQLWDCRRAPHALFVDCVYLVCKHKSIKMTSRDVAKKTREYFGVGTQPRPNEGCKDYDFIVNEVLG